MDDVIIGWREQDRTRLRETRIALGHSQRQAAEELLRLGAPSVTQATVSEWETGRTKRPSVDAIRAIRAYWLKLEEATDAPAGAPREADARGPESSGGGDMAEAAASFEALVRVVTDEPLLGPQQAALVAALTTRLGNGPPLSDADDAARQWLANVLKLEAGPH